MRTLCRFVILASAVFGPLSYAAEPSAPEPRGESNVTRIWLSQASLDPELVTISWESAVAENSVVELSVGSPAPGSQVVRHERPDSPARAHAVEVRPPVKHGPWFYRVGGLSKLTPWIKARGFDADELRTVIVADIGYGKQPWAEAVLREDPHLVLTAGDNVPQLHEGGKPADKTNVRAFQKLIDQAPRLFEAVPFVPVLGNHDREIRPRGPKPPAEAVYDVTANAFRRFFALPGNETFWHHDLPQFGVRFVALDLNHVQDFGTTWQTCNAFGPESEQFLWYRETMRKSNEPFVITIYNEKHSTVRGLAGGIWTPHVLKSSAVVTGFGYFAERSEHGGVPCFNTSISGRGDKYPDPKSAVLKSEDNFLLLKFRKAGPAHAELKSLTGEVLDSVDLPPRAQQKQPASRNRRSRPAKPLRTRVVTQPLVLKQGAAPGDKAIFDGAGLVIDLGLDVTDHAWRREGSIWRSTGKLLGANRSPPGKSRGSSSTKYRCRSRAMWRPRSCIPSERPVATSRQKF
ncbi:MAG: metallophosphoesterase [Pirellulales bacterium]